MNGDMSRPTRQDEPGDAGKNKISAPSLSLPKGGGAIRGIGEKFGANPVTGTGSMTVPIAASPGRAGFGPQLSLAYDSGAGNGPFGFGWHLALPSLTRKTDKGLPQYIDGAESDTFLLSGAEDLVPLLIEHDGQWTRDISLSTLYGQQYSIHRYRPRIEGLFACIERWANLSDPQDTFWRSISRDNITTWYGKTVVPRVDGKGRLGADAAGRPAQGMEPLHPSRDTCVRCWHEVWSFARLPATPDDMSVGVHLGSCGHTPGDLTLGREHS